MASGEMCHTRMLTISTRCCYLCWGQQTLFTRCRNFHDKKWEILHYLFGVIQTLQEIKEGGNTATKTWVFTLLSTWMTNMKHPNPKRIAQHSPNWHCFNFRYQIPLNCATFCSNNNDLRLATGKQTQICCVMHDSLLCETSDHIHTDGGNDMRRHMCKKNISSHTICRILTL